MQTNNNALIESNGGSVYVSFSPDTIEGKKALYKAMTTPDRKVSDEVGEIINVKDLLVSECTFVDDETGETTEGVRTILIDTNGMSHASTSMGVYNAIKNAVAIFGYPTWEEGLTFKVGQIQKDTKRIITLNIQ